MPFSVEEERWVSKIGLRFNVREECAFCFMTAFVVRATSLQSEMIVEPLRHLVDIVANVSISY